MKLQLKRVHLHVSFLFAVSVTLMLILDDSGAAAITLAACFLHESGHLVCLLLCGAAPRQVSLGIFGMRIDRASSISLSLRQEALVCLAGPFFNLLAVLLCLAFYRAADGRLALPLQANLALALFNLLPIEPLDGSQTLYFLLCLRREEAEAKRACMLLSYFLVVPLILFGVILLVKSGYNFTLLAVSVYLFALLFFKKEKSFVT